MAAVPVMNVCIDIDSIRPFRWFEYLAAPAHSSVSRALHLHLTRAHTNVAYTYIFHRQMWAEQAAIPHDIIQWMSVIVKSRCDDSAAIYGNGGLALKQETNNSKQQATNGISQGLSTLSHRPQRGVAKFPFIVYHTRPHTMRIQILP